MNSVNSLAQSQFTFFFLDFGVYYSNFKGKVKQFSALVVNHFTQFDFYAIQKWATSSIVILGRNEFNSVNWNKNENVIQLAEHTLNFHSHLMKKESKHFR